MGECRRLTEKEYLDLKEKFGGEPVGFSEAATCSCCALDYLDGDPGDIFAPRCTDPEAPWCYCNYCQAENPFTNQDSSNGCPDCLSRNINCCYQSYYKENPGTGSCIQCIDGLPQEYGPSCSSLPSCPFGLTLEECESYDWVDYYAPKGDCENYTEDGYTYPVYSDISEQKCINGGGTWTAY